MQYVPVCCGRTSKIEIVNLKVSPTERCGSSALGGGVVDVAEKPDQGLLNLQYVTV
jgi:hypothetical protein